MGLRMDFAKWSTEFERWIRWRRRSSYKTVEGDDEANVEEEFEECDE